MREKETGPNLHDGFNPGFIVCTKRIILIQPAQMQTLSTATLSWAEVLFPNVTSSPMPLPSITSPRRCLSKQNIVKTGTKTVLCGTKFALWMSETTVHHKRVCERNLARFVYFLHIYSYWCILCILLTHLFCGFISSTIVISANTP